MKSTEIRQEAARVMLAALKRVREEGCQTVYANESDECGEKGCCGALSYKDHADDCWTRDVCAAIALAEGVES